MDLNFSDEDFAFQLEVRNWIKENYPEEMRARKQRSPGGALSKEDHVYWQQALAKKGWAAPGWPAEHGGPEFTPTQRYLFDLEMASADTPAIIPFGLGMVAPVIMKYGSEAQKKKYLPDILATNVWWCQGYSEPGSGSDLASLQCKAELDGEDYVINGSKIWTTYAQYADWIFCLVRTDNSGRKQEGITFMLIDMNSPGVTVRPIATIDGFHHLNEVFFEDVRVPVANRIGEEGKGWTYAKSLLVHERLSIAEVADSQGMLAKIRDLARREINGGKPLLEDARFAQRLSDVEIELMALEFTELRVLADAAKGVQPGPESSLLKLQGTEIQQTLQELLMDVSGYYSQTLQGDLSDEEFGNDYADLARKLYFRGRASTIYGGSNEVQKNITAKYVLGLAS
jgi:alkylation response protein AidB-like acyl-CoA dehydrogenase